MIQGICLTDPKIEKPASWTKMPQSPLLRQHFDGHKEAYALKATTDSHERILAENKEYLQKLALMPQRGRIELIMGPMFAGKSTELLRRVKRFEIAGRKTLSIKYSADTRYSKDAISTHDLQIKSAFACKKLSDISDHDWSCFDVIGIDEGQFFEDLVSFSEKASNMGKIILISALNSTFERKGWNQILELIPLCEKVKKLSAICKLCSSNANFTFRTCSGQSQEMIGGAEMYMPLCRDCFNEMSKIQKQQMDHPNTLRIRSNDSSEGANHSTTHGSSNDAVVVRQETTSSQMTCSASDAKQGMLGKEHLLDMYQFVNGSADSSHNFNSEVKEFEKQTSSFEVDEQSPVMKENIKMVKKRNVQLGETSPQDNYKENQFENDQFQEMKDVKISGGPVIDYSNQIDQMTEIENLRKPRV